MAGAEMELSGARKESFEKNSLVSRQLVGFPAGSVAKRVTMRKFYKQQWKPVSLFISPFGFWNSRCLPGTHAKREGAQEEP